MIKPKNDMMYQDIYNCIWKIQKNEDILSIMSNLQTSNQSVYILKNIHNRI